MTNKFRTESISKLLLKQAVPASIGILVMSLNMIVDTIFVGRWIGVIAIAAVTVVLPIAFLMSSVGMGIGVGGSSIISRALGDSNKIKAINVFGNQVTLTVSMSLIFVCIGTIFCIPLLTLFGANGQILEPAKEYFSVIIWGVPFLAFAMMGNPVIRAIGKPNFAMFTMILPAIMNVVLDIICIKVLNQGIYGAGLATSISYITSGTFVLWFFFFKQSEFSISKESLIVKISLVKEIIALGGITIVRQGTVSILMIVLNYSLYTYGGEISVSTYGIINRVTLFALFPILGVTQGFLPIVGFNYGANDTKRVKESIKIAIQYGSSIALLIFIGIMLFPNTLVALFTTDEELIHKTQNALLICLSATPIITIQLIGSAYFQAAGKAMPALLLTLLKQGLILVPLVYIMPKFFGVLGIWVSFPIADVIATAVTYVFLKKGLNKLPSSEP
ncbi:MATE family efflux transporter [Tenacibaculum sp. SG-28]|uniref:MATE family efflux transporter n=1 Tax=Tenacibaculum sp. SG-28 TaxID=754426 RepID=UPI000D4B16EF|nr:MATE family efflux transporter [Tenacibaculum sp. SG-28]PQJ23129.1 MATE family efflux transporter [Tenacibaculum sp. SG-28]